MRSGRGAAGTCSSWGGSPRCLYTIVVKTPPPAPGLAMGLLIAAGLVVCGLLSTGIVCCVVKQQPRRHADSPLQTVEIRRGGGINLAAQGGGQGGDQAAGVDPTAAKV